MRGWMFLLAGLSVGALVGCGEKDDDTGDDSDDECGSTEGFVSGTVTGPWSSDPNPYAFVVADDGSGGQIDAEMGGDGTYELNLEPGEYLLFAEAEGCYSEDYAVTVTECEEYTVDISIQDCDVADKPNLYVYPNFDTPMHVQVEHSRRQQIVASDPPHGKRGWNGVAHPDGTFTQNGDRAPFLFYEVSLAPWQSRTLQRDAGWCITGRRPVAAMADILSDYGFNAIEVDDFIEAWRHDLPPARAYSVFPQHKVDHIAGLDIEPQVPVERLWLLVEEGSGCAPLFEPEVVPLDRRGAHAVEWGVVLHGLGR
jgi:hypothetical protein